MYQMKALVITNSYPTKKNIVASIFVKEQLESLKKINPELDITLYYNPVFRFIRKIESRKNGFYTIIKYALFCIYFFPYLFRKFDIVHAHQCFFPGVLAYLYKKIHNTPMVITSHGGDIDFMAKNKWIFKIEKKIFNHADSIIAVSTVYKNKIIDLFDIKASKINVISCGIDLNIFKNITNKQQIRKELGLESSGIYLLFVGNLIERKGPDIFLKALHRISNDKIKGIIIGEGILKNNLAELDAKQKMNILFKNNMPHDELIKWFQASDIFIFPSRTEPFGLVGVEALAAGIPVIASMVGGKTDYIIDNYNGLFFENENAMDLSAKILKLLGDINLITKMQDNASTSVQKYDLVNQAKLINDIYKALI